MLFVVILYVYRKLNINFEIIWCINVGKWMKKCYSEDVWKYDYLLREKKVLER